jgi:hypothetical protein
VIVYRAGEAFSFAAHQFQRVADGDVSQGAEVIRDYAEGPGWLLGGNRIEDPAATGPAGELGIRYAGHLGRCGDIHLCLRMEDPDATVAALRKREVEIFAEPFVVEPIGQRLAMIKDNSGNVIELAQAISS